MGRPWTIDKGKPIKVRVVPETERGEWGDVSDRPVRTRVKSRAVRAVVTLWMLSVGAMLQACHHYWGAHGGSDRPQDAIDGQDNPFGIF